MYLTIKKIVEQLGVFSNNEELDDVTTMDLKYGVVMCGRMSLTGIYEYTTIAQTCSIA